MVGTIDLGDKAEGFALSVRLQTTSTAIGNLEQSRELTPVQQENLAWASELIRGVNWHSERYSSRNPKLNVLATRARPLFYDALIKERYAGDATDFYNRLEQTLESQGEKMALSPEELLLAQRMTYQVSQEILSRLQASNREEDDD